MLKNYKRVLQLDWILRKEAVEGIERLMRRRGLTVVVTRSRKRGAGTATEARRTSVCLTNARRRPKPALRHRSTIVKRKRVENEPAWQTLLDRGSGLKSLWDNWLVKRLARHLFISTYNWQRNRLRINVAVAEKALPDRALSLIEVWWWRFTVCRRFRLWLYMWLHLRLLTGCTVTIFVTLWLICDRLRLCVIFEKKRFFMWIRRRLAGPTVWTRIVVFGGIWRIDELTYFSRCCVARRRAWSRLWVWLWWFTRVAFVAVFLVRRVPRIFDVFFDGFFALFWSETFDF